MKKFTLFSMTIKKNYSAIYITRIHTYNYYIIPQYVYRSKVNYKLYAPKVNLTMTICLMGAREKYEYFDEYIKNSVSCGYEYWQLDGSVPKPKYRNKLKNIAVNEDDRLKFIKSVQAFTNSDTRNVLE